MTVAWYCFDCARRVTYRWHEHKGLRTPQCVECGGLRVYRDGEEDR